MTAGGSRALLALLVVGCGGATTHYPAAKEAVWRDTDLDMVNVHCEKRPSEKDKNHISCAPEPYISPLAWDAADNTLFRPVSKFFAVDPPREARNVNAFDEVPDSAWFTNRLGKKKPPIEELVRGACRQEDLLDGEQADPTKWVIDQGKPNGASPGFRVKIAGSKKYMFKTDTKEQPERPSAASAIGAAIYHNAGFNTSCEQIVYVDIKNLHLTPGLSFTANDGVTRKFDDKALEKVLTEAAKKGGTYRFQASAWLGGYLLGPFKYEGTRSDDPNDIIPHEDRRDLRGARVLAAWLHHFDAREQNSMDSWMAKNAKDAESSPGWVKHYYLDTSDCFGSEWVFDGISRRLGHSYLLDFEDIGFDFITLGAVVRPWEREKRQPGMEMFGYYHWQQFDPERWYNEYPNPAFSRATEHDDAWMARILSRFDREDINELAKLGKFSNPEATEFLSEVMEMRLRKILDRYLLNLSPLTDFKGEGDKICGTDLALRRHVRTDDKFQFRARVLGGQPLTEIDAVNDGKVCVTLPHTKADDYRIVSIWNGVSKGRADVHVVDLGAGQGFKVVGLDRPDP